ncbi:glucoamylase family protein [Psychroserpens sp. Hel_I_66]|uniref:glucoamylase family protein n=1 Tax=Psychroserpens sp. Hel_I_66 TaxID=1250004 RepID=UPI00064859DD|nr:glucoamylase family protein [Psychroserpens sp. Hel_I_66]
MTINIKAMSLIKPVIIVITLLMMSNCTNQDITPPPPDVGSVDEPTVETIPFEELLDLVQQRTFNYFWDFAEPVSGLARETSQDAALGGDGARIVTTGGSGFGIACFPAAVERGWITRAEAVERLDKILTFLEGCETYHGVFSHWYFGDTGVTREFSALDDGADIVETAFLLQGLLINRQYLSASDTEEALLINRITTIYENIEWSFFERGENVMTWHWSPDNGFAIDLQIQGWNEALMVYVLAAGSPTFPITKATYDNGWARNGQMINNNTYVGTVLPLGVDFGGPLFYSHYSFIGLNPTNLSDQYANYFEQNVAHSLINYEYCKNNPNDYIGYGGDSWGLTASNDFNGYAVHDPLNDIGVITPTAALSSFPYTPEQSKKALEYFYYNLNDRLWGEYGFYDAFSEEFNWFDDGYLAIDQGPIVAMIENYRSQLLWNLFMQDQDVINGLNTLEFTF